MTGPIFLPLMLGASSAPATLPVQVSLTCSMLNPNAESVSLKVDLEEGEKEGIVVVYSVLSGERNTPEKVAHLTTTVSEKSVVREYVLADDRGPLNLTLINAGNEWAAQLAPASWGYGMGPLVTGRCGSAQLKSGQLKSFVESSDIPFFGVTPGPVNLGKLWNGATEKSCVLTDGKETTLVPLSISESGELFFEGDRGSVENAAIFSLGEVAAGFKTFSESQPADHDEILKIFSRQGRFWIDFSIRRAGQSDAWYRGVCVSNPPKEKP